MLEKFFAEVNWWAIIVSAILYWLLGMLWFSALFGKMWADELEKHGVKIKEAPKGGMASKSILSFICNFLAVLGVALVCFAGGSWTIVAGIKFGLMLGICFGAGILGVMYIWEGKSMKSFLIDAAYHLVGIIISAIIFSTWWSQPAETMPAM